MFKVILIRVLLLLLFCSIVLPGHALEILFSRYSVNDGLASNFVNCVWQDPRGFMWVGTDNGLQRYDGSKFTSFYRNSNQQKLPALAVHQILRDARSTMWIRMGSLIGTFNTFNYTFKEVKVVSRHPIPSRSEYYLRRDFKGNLLLTILKFGIFVYNDKKQVFEENRNVIYVPSELGLNHSFEDKKTGNYWLSTEKGLALYNFKNKKIETANHPGWNKAFLKQPGLSKKIVHLHIDNQRRYWIISMASGVPKTYCYDESGGKFTSDTAGLNSDKGYFEIKDLKESRGILWAYGLNFLKIYGPEEKGFYTFYDSDSNYGIKFNTINHIFEDREKNIWIATDNGLYAANVVFNEARHGIIKTLHNKNSITTILKTSDSHVLFNKTGRGIEAIKIKGDTFIRDEQFRNLIYQNQPKSQAKFQQVLDMEEHTSSRTLWLSCNQGGIISYSIKNKKAKFLTPEIFKGESVTQIAQDLSGNLWFATQAGQLVRLQKNNSSSNDFKPVVNLHTDILKLYTDRKNFLWVTTSDKGIYMIDTRTSKIIRNFTADGKKGFSLSHTMVKDVIQLNDSLFYAATGNLDIINIKTGRIKTLTLYDGLPFNSVSSLQLDRSGDLWLSTIGGICTYNYKRHVFRVYDQKDGLITTTSADNLLNTSIKLDGNKLMFAGGSNFVAFDPDLIKDKKRPDNVTITDLKLLNTNLPVDSILKLDKLRLTSDQNSLTIEFATLNYNRRNKLKYYYMLAGADDDWIKTDGPIAANYALLPAGNYTFKVKSVNSEGLESPYITQLPIYIKPAFWQTWWFISLVTIFASGLTYLLYRFRLNQLIQVQKIRERVARDLHDDMGSTLSTINILSEMAKVKIKTNVDTAEDYIGKISDNSIRMMEAMDDIVWSIKPSNDSIQKITARMREFAAGILEPKNIDYSFQLDDKVKEITLDMESRRDLFLIFKEAINNLAKYSGAEKATIQLYQKEKKLVLQIEDNGKGFLIDTTSPGNGLLNMKKRSEKLKGKFSIHSEINIGTRICLELSIT